MLRPVDSRHIGAGDDAMIEVKQTGHSDPLSFDVVIQDSGSQTRHQVTLSKADYGRLTNGACPAELLVEAAFRFLLDRESKEAILSRFDISVISHYFPDFETKLPRYMACDSAE
jgi:hypothetical protein